MTRVRSLSCLVLALVFACADAPTPEGDGRLAVDLAALNLAGVGDVVWDVEVVSGTGDTVWQRRLSSSGYGDGAGSASYVGTCDAGDGAASNTVRVWVVGVYGAAVTDAGSFASGSTAGAGAVTGSPVDFQNPTSDGPLTRTVTCRADADVAVDFDVTLARRAQQGFFDVAVQFDDIFCSAKLDCESAPGQDLDLLHAPGGGRAMTAVLGFACTANPGTQTWLYMDDPVVTCDGFSADVVVDPGGKGAVDLGVAPSQNADGYLFGASVFRGREQLADKVYWNVAFGLDEAAFASAGGCVLTGRATAASEAWPQTANGFPIPAGVVYPVVHWTVALSDADSRECTTHEVDELGSGVSTEYEGYLAAANTFTWGTTAVTLDNRYDAAADVVLRGTTAAPSGAPLLSLGSGPRSVDPIDGETPGGCTELTLTNTGDEAGGGDYAYTLSGADAGAFELCQPDTDTVCDGELQPGEACALGVALKAAEDGSFAAQLNVESVDALFTNLVVQGTADNLDPTLEQPTGPLAVYPITNATGSPGPCTPVPITNTGGAPSGQLAVTFSGADPTHFEECDEGLLEPCGLTLDPGETCELGVRLLSEVNATFTADATIESGPLSIVRALTGEAYGLTPQLAFDAGPIHVADLTSATTSGCVPLTVTNVGSGAGGGSYALTFSGADRALFTACTAGLSSPCSGALSPGGTCQVGVEFGSIQAREHAAVARLSAAGGLTATVSLTATATGENLPCSYDGPGWCRRYSYPYPVGSTLTEALTLCDADPDCVGVSTYRGCIGSADDTCDNGNGTRSRYARCTDLDYSRWPDRYASFRCPGPALSLGTGVLDLGGFTGGTSPCLSIPVTNVGDAFGGANYALSFSGGDAAEFEGCAAASSPCSGYLDPGETCNMGVRVVTSDNGVLTTTATLTTDDTNAPTRSLRVTSGGLVAELSFDQDPKSIAALNGAIDSGCVPVSITNTGTATGGGNYAVSFSGPDAGTFSSCSSGFVNACSGTLDPGQSCNLGVRFSATSDGSFTATATVTAAGGLSDQATVLASTTGLGALTCPYIGPGWCKPYSYPYPAGTTLAQAQMACDADPQCVGISTYQSCIDGPGDTCDSSNKSRYARCTELDFSSWPTNYASYACAGFLDVLGDPVVVDPVDGATGGACTPVTVTNTSGTSTDAAVTGALSGSDAAAFAMCTAGLSTPCGGPLDVGESCQLGVQLVSSVDGSYSATLTASATGGTAATATVIGQVSGYGPTLDVGAGTFVVGGIDNDYLGACTALTVSNVGLGATTDPVTATFSGGQAPHFRLCTGGLTSPCGATTLAPGETCELGVQLLSSTDGTFGATMIVSSVGAESDSRWVQGTAVDAVVAGAVVTGLQIHNNETQWVGISEIDVIDDLGSDVTSGFTAVAAPYTGFGTAGQVTTDTTYGPSSSRVIRLVDDADVGSAWVWNSSNQGGDWNIWLNFGTLTEVREVYLTFSTNYQYPHEPASGNPDWVLTFLNDSGVEITPISAQAVGNPTTVSVTWRYDFYVP